MEIMSYEIFFELSPLNDLDQLCLLADQDYNYGNKKDWFGYFRGGLHGAVSRLHAVRTHYNAIHAWVPMPRPPLDAECNLSNVLFGMDSAIECLTYAMNAIGNCVDESKFRDIADEKALRRISPLDVYGDPLRTHPTLPLQGYSIYFGDVQKVWIAARDTMQSIMDQHDVSKHRETIFMGGQTRQDPPVGFFETLGINHDEMKWPYQPMAEIILDKHPKSTKINKYPMPQNDLVIFEQLAEEYRLLIDASVKCMLTDVKKVFKLNFTSFKK